MTTFPFPGTDWNDDERAEIRRLKKVCDDFDEWVLLAALASSLQLPPS
jgi:hypothetical protein